MSEKDDLAYDPVTGLSYDDLDNMSDEELAFIYGYDPTVLKGGFKVFLSQDELTDEDKEDMEMQTTYPGMGAPTGHGAPTVPQYGKGAKGSTTYSYGPKCTPKHPPMEIIEGVRIWGSSGSNPVVDDADVYVGLDSNMAGHWSLLPWYGAQGVLFKITDMSTPSKPEEFQKLIDWLESRLRAGAKVHVGCIGGHGRTGMVLAALVKQMRGEDDAIRYVRKHYCEEAVETKSQVEFLHKHFGIKQVEAAKKVTTVSSGSAGGSQFDASPVESELVIWGDMDVD